jgi:hypothetical protein
MSAKLCWVGQCRLWNQMYSYNILDTLCSVGIVYSVYSSNAMSMLSPSAAKWNRPRIWTASQRGYY